MEALQVGGEMNELMSTKMCSPLIVYFGVVVLCGISVYLARDHLKRHNTHKMDNLFNMYTFNEVKFMIVLGITIFGLCQYNKTTLAWVFLIFPIIYCIIQAAIIHIHVSSGVQNAPKVNNFIPESHYVGAGAGGAPLNQGEQQQRATENGIYIPPAKYEVPVNTSVSTPLTSMESAQTNSVPSGFSGTGAGNSDTYAQTYF